MEIQDDSVQSGQKVLIVDDCLATGGNELFLVYIVFKFLMLEKCGSSILT